MTDVESKDKRPGRVVTLQHYPMAKAPTATLGKIIRWQTGNRDYEAVHQDGRTIAVREQDWANGVTYSEVAL